MDGEKEVYDLFQLVEIQEEIERRLKDLPEGGVLRIMVTISPKAEFPVGHPCNFPKTITPVELKREDTSRKAVKIIKEGFSPQTAQVTVVI